MAGGRGYGATTRTSLKPYVRFGVTPSMLDIEAQGRKARVWLRSGESVAAVRARLLEAGVEVA
jgi:hypothetical protein